MRVASNRRVGLVGLAALGALALKKLVPVESDWIRYLLAAAVFIAIYFGDKWGPRLWKRDRRMLGAVAVVATCVVIYVIWPERLDLEGSISNLRVMTRDGAPGYVLVTAYVVNRGDPTTVSGYQLCATLLAGSEICAHRETIPNVLHMHVPNAPEQYAYASDSLMAKTAEAPIPTGGRAIGRLLFHFPGRSNRDLGATGVLYRMEFKDVWGKKYNTTMVYDAKAPSSTPKSHPGLEEFTTPPPKR